METWLKIGTAVLLGGMILMLLPQARQMLRHSPAPQAGDWQAFILPLVAVAAFVALLMWLV